MPFEPQLPGPYQYLFHGHIQTQVSDPQGTPAATVISMTDEWHLEVTWQLHGIFVPLLCGIWHVRAYLESIGPGPELIIADEQTPMTGANNYRLLLRIPPNRPSEEGPYKLVTVITAKNQQGNPAPFAGFDEGPVLAFYSGASLPPVPPTP